MRAGSGVNAFLAWMLIITVVVPEGLAWHAEGHAIIVRAAMKALPEEMPAFFRQGAAVIVHCSADPDAFRQPWARQLIDQEDPEHYFDLEYLGGRAIPARRSEYLKLLRELDRTGQEVGFLPYAIAEWTERLTVALAEHRAFPQDPAIQAKCLVYAGILAHYAADLTQPLHTTVHYNGRADAMFRSPRSGIHRRVDVLIERLNLDPARIAEGLEPVVFEEVWPAVLRELEASHALVDRVYELEALLPSDGGSERRREGEAADGRVAEFAQERAKAAARFTGSLYWSAWRKSAEVVLPEWLIRARRAEGAVPATEPSR